MGFTENVECHLNTNDLRLVYRALKKLHSKSTSEVSPIRTADGCLVSDADRQKVRWVAAAIQGGSSKGTAPDCRVVDAGC